MSSSPSPVPPPHGRFVTACQQLLALGVVLAVLTPAAGVVSLDVVPGNGQLPRAAADPSDPSDPAAPASMAAYARASSETAVVPDEPVDAVVEEYSLTPPAGARVVPGGLQARSVPRPGGGSEVTSRPQPVTGYGAIGVTWEHGAERAADEIGFQARMREQGEWSEWTPIEYDDEHGPDPDSAEYQQARPGTDELLVGDVDEVQVRIDSDEPAPADLKLAVIDPGTPGGTASERPAIDTGADDVAPTTETESAETEGSDGIALQAGTFTPKPKIFSRAQWGADERLRDRGSLHYHEVHAGFVHHTVNANAYSRDQVPGILRSIYAYHTQSRGWSDVGYNYLVDRFGRIWEGRAGGVDRPVVGAHTLGYNDDAFAMSAIGNLDIAQPTSALVQAYGALFAWKLSLHGVKASSDKQFVTSRNFKAINGHRDAGSTACPGRYLYAKIPQIRQLAAQAQKGWDGRQLEGSLVSSDQPDLVVRRKSDGKAFIIPIRGGGPYSAGKPVATSLSLAKVKQVMRTGDWDRDGRVDLITRAMSGGSLYLRRGLGQGEFARAERLGGGFSGVRMLAAVGDMTGDGRPDLMGQPTGDGMRIYPGRKEGFRPSYLASGRVDAVTQVPTGLWTGDGAPDSIFRKGPTLTLRPGNGPGGLTAGRQLGLDVSSYDWLVGVRDVGGGRHPDLVARSKGSGKLWLLPANSKGFLKRQLLAGNMAGYDLVG